MKKIKIALALLSGTLSLQAQVADDLDHKDTDTGGVLEDKTARLLELKKDTALYAPGETKVYQGEYLDAIDFHVGGIGGGAIRLDGKARLRTWQIFNNMTELPLPDSFFAIRAAAEGSSPVVRALNTAGEGEFSAMESLTFTGEYPFANYRFADSKLPLDVSMEAYNPMIPLDAKNSSIPLAVFNIKKWLLAL